jgi:hypothetical protein
METKLKFMMTIFKERERGIPDKATMLVVERPLDWNPDIRMLRLEAG